MFKKTIALIVVAAMISGSAFAAEVFVVDKAHTDIGFSVKHLVISSTKGNFGDFDGKIMYDAEDVTKSSVEMTIKTASIDTDNEDRDKHLRSGDFFDVEKYPEITFKSKRIENRDDGMVAIGDFTMHGVTKEIQLPFTITGVVKDPWGNTKMGVEAETKIDRTDYGLTWSKVLETGGLVVGNEVKIMISAEFGMKE